jgi:hypothetical protein
MKVKNRRNFFGGKSYHFELKKWWKMGKYADGSLNYA